MPHYVIGDLQGCHAEFCQLLDLIGFSPREDRLWLVGDLVNRGPGSLAVLREVMALGDAAVTVLGNHDFHLLTVAAGHRKPHRSDTLDAILEAPDRDALVAWLASPAVYYSLVSPTYSHAPSLMVCAVFCDVWLRTRGRDRVTRDVGLGLLAGLAALVRWQDAVILVLPGLELVTSVAAGRRTFVAAVRSVSVMVLAA